MSDDTKWSIVVFAFFALFIGSLSFGSYLDDEVEWNPSDKPGCYLRVVSHDRLSAPDYTSRTLYCPVKR